MNSGTPPPDQSEPRRSPLVGRRTLTRVTSVGVLLLASVGLVPVASAHGGAHTPNIPQWYGLVILLFGLGVFGVSVLADRRGWLVSSTPALGGVFLGIVIAALGGILMVQLSPIDEYSAGSMPFPRAWYLPLTLGVGLFIILLSVNLGVWRWPTRPRYTVLGLLLGLWVAYPALIQGAATYHHPLGYGIALAVPLLVSYIIWYDGREVLRAVAQDPVARRFGLGVGVVMGGFFMFSTGLLALVPEEGIVNGHRMIHTPAFIDTVPTANPLVVWPSVAFWFPQIPLSGLLSVGTLLMVGLLGGLVGLNAMLAAYQWLHADSATTTQSTAGAAALVCPNACGCCGPMFAQLAVVLVGPAAAAPLYWLFVDFSSPVGAFFFVASVVLLTGGFVYSTYALAPDVCSVPADGQPRSAGQPESSD